MTKYYIEKEYIKVDYYIKNAKVVWCIDESFSDEGAIEITVEQFQNLKKENKILAENEAVKKAILDRYYDIDLESEEDFSKFEKIKHDESGFEVFEIWKTEEWKSYLLGFLENTNFID